MSEQRLIDICDILYGYPFDSSKFSETPEGGMPLVRIRDVKEGSTETYYKGAFPKEYIIHRGDFLVGMDGEFNIAAWRSEDALLNQRVCRVVSKNRGVLTTFLFRFLKKELKRIEDETPFVTVKHLSAKRLGQVYLDVPPLAEQERIVAELDLLQGIIDKQKVQLKELDTLAQSIFYDMFGSVDENKKGFPVEPLNSVFSLITDGTHQTPEYTEDKIHGYKFLSAKDVVSGVIDWSRIKYIPEYLHKELCKRLAPQRGDILLCKNGTTGICALVDTDDVFDIYVSLALLRTTRNFSKRYLVAAINSPSTKRQFDDSLKGVGVPNLHLGEIKKTRILVPPYNQQESFAAKVDAIEQQKAMIKQSIAETQKLFDYTMDKYFG